MLDRASSDNECNVESGTTPAVLPHGGILFTSGFLHQIREKFFLPPRPERGVVKKMERKKEGERLSFAVSINKGPALVTHLPNKRQYFAQKENEKRSSDSPNFSKGRGSQCKKYPSGLCCPA